MSSVFPTLKNSFFCSMLFGIVVADITRADKEATRGLKIAARRVEDPELEVSSIHPQMAIFPNERRSRATVEELGIAVF